MKTGLLVLRECFRDGIPRRQSYSSHQRGSWQAKKNESQNFNLRLVTDGDVFLVNERIGFASSQLARVNF